MPAILEESWHYLKGHVPEQEPEHDPPAEVPQTARPLYDQRRHRQRLLPWARCETVRGLVFFVSQPPIQAANRCQRQAAERNAGRQFDARRKLIGSMHFRIGWGGRQLHGRSASPGRRGIQVEAKAWEADARCATKLTCQRQRINPKSSP